jgi:hypothetical protein
VAGDKGNAKAAYQAFLTLWKDADPDVLILMQAKTEYASYNDGEGPTALRWRPIKANPGCALLKSTFAWFRYFEMAQFGILIWPTLRNERVLWFGR